MSVPSIVYVTAGTHGAGHLARGVALGRALAATGRPHRYTLLAPEGPHCFIGDPWWSPVVVDPSQLARPETAATSALATSLLAARPDVVVVDLFWVPLFYIPIAAPVWLLLRSVPEVWLKGPPQAQFDAHKYAHILAIEPAPGLEGFERWPAVVCPPLPGTVYSRDALCWRLGVDPRAPLRLRARAGIPDDDAVLGDAAVAQWGHPGQEVTLEGNPELFPLGPWLASLEAGDEVVAGAGYNLFWEARANRVTARVHWIPLRRRIDAQHARVAFGAAPYPTDGAQMLAQALLRACGA